MKIVLFFLSLALSCALCEAGQFFSSETPAVEQRRTRYQEARHEERLAEEQRAAEQEARDMEAQHLIDVVEHAAALERAEIELSDLRRSNAHVRQIMKQKTLIRQLKTNPPTTTPAEAARAQFGKFVCAPCGNKWSSANAYQGYRQGCRVCPSKTPTLPVTLTDLVGSGNHRDDANGPHQSAQCERCQRQLPCRGRR